MQVVHHLVVLEGTGQGCGHQNVPLDPDGPRDKLPIVSRIKARLQPVEGS